jgi:hypothetical protein
VAPRAAIRRKRLTDGSKRMLSTASLSSALCWAYSRTSDPNIGLHRLRDEPCTDRAKIKARSGHRIRQKSSSGSAAKGKLSMTGPQTKKHSGAYFRSVPPSNTRARWVKGKAAPIFVPSVELFFYSTRFCSRTSESWPNPISAQQLSCDPTMHRSFECGLTFGPDSCPASSLSGRYSPPASS